MPTRPSRRGGWRPGPRRPDPATLARIEAEVRAETHRLYAPDGLAPPAAVPVRAHRRPVRLLVAAGVAALTIGGAAGAAIVLQGGDGSVVVDPTAQRPIQESDDLRRAPWLFQPDGSPHIATVAPGRALEFPPGTTYAQAVTRLVRGVLAEGTVPPGTRPVDPLPVGVVWQTGTPTAGPLLSLVAPLGYSVPEGRIRTPSYRFAAGVTIDQARALLLRSRRGSPLGAAALRGVSVDVPALARCQVAPPGATPVPCRLDPPPAAPEPGS